MASAAQPPFPAMSAAMKRLAVASLVLLAPAAAQVSKASFLEATDLNRDGRVSLQEMIDAGAMQNPPLAVSEATFRFQRKDVNQDGFLEGDELTGWTQNELSYLKKSLPNPVSKSSFLSEADVNPTDSRISMPEAIAWGSQQSPPANATEIMWRFNRRDADMDGFLEKEELVDFTKNEVDYLMKNLPPAPPSASLVEVAHHTAKKQGNLRKADNSKLFDRIMKQADVSPEDGHVSFAEAKAWAAAHFPGAKEADVSRQFSQHDLDADGFLSLAELATLPFKQQVAA